MNLEETLPLPQPETAMFSRYRLKTELGRGGMGVVWRAEDTKLQRDVALKFLPELVVRDREAMADLANETRRCLDLTHPNIVRVYDLVEENGRAAISMELVDGPSLAERKLHEPQRCFSAAALENWIAQLCAALDYAHTKAHIVHRDLKPLNLLVNAEGDLKIVDFGIARSLVRSATRLSTEVQSTSVSVGYVGPQQLMGAPAAVTDDIYSLGATIYELLTSKPPFFDGDIITQLREVVPPTMTARRSALGIIGREIIPPEWEETVAACLAKKAEDRPKTAGEVARRLGLPVPSLERNPTSPTRQSRGHKYSRGVRVAFAAATLGVLIGAGLFWSYARSQAEQTAQQFRRSGNKARKGAAAAPAPEFVVRVTPPDVGARVWLGKASDKPVPDDGRLALTALSDGPHELTVQASGYETYTSRVTIKGGRGEIDVKLLPVFGPVQVTGRAGTIVTVIDAGGRKHLVGTIPASGNLRADTVVTVGTYTFNLAHPDCLDAKTPPTPVAKGRVTRVAPVQTTLPGELRIFSVPDGADVFLNGKKAGVTPATLIDVPSGKPVTVEVYLSGYRRITRSVTLKPDQKLPVYVGTLVLENAAIQLRMGAQDFQVPNALVRVDGRVVALKSGRIEGLEVGPRVVEIIHPDYEPWKQTVTARDRDPITVAVTLVPKAGELTFAVTGPEAFTLSVNGKSVVVKNNRATVPTGELLALEVAAKGYKTDRRALTLPPRGKQTLTIALEKMAVPEIGKPWTVPDMNIALLPLPAGTFAMGSKRGDPTERPITQVRLTKPFWLGKTEVTQREWTAVMIDNPSRDKGDDHPVENVSWLDAIEFCRKLTERERAADRLPSGYAYALPTEAQWEYACRAGATEDAPLDVGEITWHHENSGDVSHPVAAQRPNAWGFYDMIGNVWEWCLDGYADKLKGGEVDDPKGNPAAAMRVRRGGSYVLKPDYFRFALRGKAEPDYRLYNVGFRVALSPDAAAPVRKN